MRVLIVALFMAALLACANTPFSGDPDKQAHGSTAANDAEREVFTEYVATKYIRTDVEKRKAYVEQLADILAAVRGTTGATGSFLDEALDKYVEEQNLLPEDEVLVDYLRAKVVDLLPDVSVPLSPEMLRVLGVYEKALRDAVETFEG